MAKRLGKIVAIVLVLTLCFSSTAIAVSPRSSDYITTASANIFRSSGNIIVSFTIQATGSMSKLGASMIEIKNANGVTVKTLHAASTSGMITTNSASFRGSVTYTPEDNGQYYAVVYFIASNSNGYGTGSVTTAKV